MDVGKKPSVRREENQESWNNGCVCVSAAEEVSRKRKIMPDAAET